MNKVLLQKRFLNYLFAFVTTWLSYKRRINLLFVQSVQTTWNFKNPVCTLHGLLDKKSKSKFCVCAARVNVNVINPL